MKRIITAATGAALACVIAIQPLAAQQSAGNAPLPQIASTTVPEVAPLAGRNISAAVHHRKPLKPQPAGDPARPPGAQALMVLGIALIVTPAMFRGAFSN